MSLPATLTTTTIRVPGTMANLGPGFDSFGLAVTLYNEFTFTVAQADELILSPIGRADISDLRPKSDFDSKHHLLWQAMDAVYSKANRVRPQIAVTVKADIPVARGLGSSSTAIVAALMGANALLENPLCREEILALAIQLEHHPDNVTPALLGGVVMYDAKPYALPWPTEWGILALSPTYPVKTSDARQILPTSISREDAVFNLRKASTLTYALLREDPDALRAALDDRLHQPYRRRLIPEMDALERLAVDLGAYGFIISGSGPTMGCFYPIPIHSSLISGFQNAIDDNKWPIDLHDVLLDRDGAFAVVSS